MIATLRMAAFLMMGGAAIASPIVMPPDGFAGTQYIDSTGCVFARAEGGWVARRDGAGQPLCGFPPSIGQRRTGAARPAVSPDAETLLMEQLTQQLRPGEWAADPQQPEQRSAPLPSSHRNPVQTTLKDALSVAPGLRQASGLDVPKDLCSRLGYSADEGGAALPSAALGLCPGMRAAPTKTPPKPVAASAAASKENSATAVIARRPAAPPLSPTRPMPEMIAASARYIQVGAFQDGDNALIVLRALSARGYPVAQTRITDTAKGMRIVMAGPFPDRQKLVEALVDLRQTGYAGAMPR